MLDTVSISSQAIICKFLRYSEASTMAAAW